MKNKIINWALKKLIIYNTEENTIDIIAKLIKHLYNNNISSIVDKELEKVIFNSKYQKDMKGNDIPYDLLQRYYKEASKGSNLYLMDYFFRILRQDKNKEVSKLNYKYKRNTN